MSLTTRAIVKSDWLNIASADTTSDALIDRLIAAVDAEIASICDQPLEQTAKTVYLSGNGYRYMSLGWTVPVVLTSVDYRATPDAAWTSITSECRVDMLSMVSRLYWATAPFVPEYVYRVIANVGYTAIPSDIVVCANEMVTELYNQTPFAANGSSFGVASISEAAGGQTITKTLLSMRPKVERRLFPYRRLTI